MIEARNEYQGHISHQDLNMNFRRSNVFHTIMKKDVQVYQDYSQQSQMLEQMKIPVNAEGYIQIPDWLDIISNDFEIPLRQAQYINIWDPVESHYVDITGYRMILAQNFKLASPIYIRYLPYQENAVPPHANLQSMMDENYYSSYQNPLYQGNNQESSPINNYQQNGQTQASLNQQSLIKSTSNKVNNIFEGNDMYSLNFQRTKSDVSGIMTSTSEKHKRQAQQYKQVMSHNNQNDIFNQKNHHKYNQNYHSNNNIEQSFYNSEDGKKMIELKQEQNSSPIQKDENILMNLKMEEGSFVQIQQEQNKSGQFNINLKKEDRDDNVSDYMNNMDSSNNSANGNGKVQNIKLRHKDSDQQSQKDSGHSNQQSDNQIKNHKQLPREKRVKERQICYVKGKVDEWRNLYDNGLINPRGEIEKVNLDVAASLVGLSRKTLDDYYAQLRKAQRYGFDFDSNLTEKMGTLRKYVKKMSGKDSNAGDDESLDTDNNLSSKSNFNTPQLKPSIPSDIQKQEMSMSVGYHSDSHKISDSNFELRQKSSSVKQQLTSAQKKICNNLFNQTKVEHSINNTSILSPSNGLYLNQQQPKQQNLSFADQILNEKFSNSFKTKSINLEENLLENSMNIENNENMQIEHMEEENDDNFTDYINSENNNDNAKQEQNDDQFN